MSHTVEMFHEEVSHWCVDMIILKKGKWFGFAGGCWVKLSSGDFHSCNWHVFQLYARQVHPFLHIWLPLQKDNV